MREGRGLVGGSRKSIKIKILGGTPSRTKLAYQSARQLGRVQDKPHGPLDGLFCIIAVEKKKRTQEKGITKAKKR